MYQPPHGIKRDPVRRWRQTDRVFFGNGACHILAGVFLSRLEHEGYSARWICPRGGLAGYHVFVTDGAIAFDHHGYASPARLVNHHGKGWAARHPGWRADVIPVDFDLLGREALNQRRMLGPDQYFGDPVARAHRFIDRFEPRRRELTASRP